MTRPTTYRGKLTKRTREKEKQRFALAFILAFCVVFGSYIMAEATTFDLETYKINAPNEQGHLPEAKDREMGVEEKIRYLADKHNFKWPDYLVRLARCESRLNPKATNHNGQYGTDRGVFQINDHFHPEVSDECAFSVECATEWTMERINAGYGHEWVCQEIVLNK